MCDIEESFIHKIEKARPDLTADPKFPQLKLQSLEQLSKLREGIQRFKDKIKNRTPADEKNLLYNYSAEIHKAYQNYKNLHPFIQDLVREIGRKQNLAGTENATKLHPFLIFIAVSSDLNYCMLIKNDIYRYPFLEFQSENLQILNGPEMEMACNELIEIMEFFLANIPSLMKPGGLAL
jgi:hypothetical protein